MQLLTVARVPVGIESVAGVTTACVGAIVVLAVLVAPVNSQGAFINVSAGPLIGKQLVAGLAAAIVRPDCVVAVLGAVVNTLHAFVNVW